MKIEAKVYMLALQFQFTLATLQNWAAKTGQAMIWLACLVPMALPKYVPAAGYL